MRFYKSLTGKIVLSLFIMFCGVFLLVGYSKAVYWTIETVDNIGGSEHDVKYTPL